MNRAERLYNTLDIQKLILLVSWLTQIKPVCFCYHNTAIRNMVVGTDLFDRFFMEKKKSMAVDWQLITRDTIIWLEGDLNYTRIHLVNQPAKFSSYTLKTFEEQLNGFIRIRKNAIVNPGHVVRLFTSAEHPRKLYVLLTNGHKIEVARRRQPFARRYLRSCTLY